MKIDDALASMFANSVISGDADKRESAYKRLGKMSPEAAEQLISTALDKASPRERLKIILSLAIESCELAVDPLCDVLLSDTSPNVRAVSAWALMQICNLSALPSLTLALSDRSEKVATTSCIAVGSILQKKTLQPLFRLLTRRSWRVRLYAAVTLLDLGVRDSRVAKTLQALSVEPDAAEHDRDVAENRRLEEQFHVPDDIRVLKGTYRTMQELIDEAGNLG